MNPSDSERLSRAADSVLCAMLCMQRHAWEQGIAMEAVRALRRDDLLYLMARDAVVRQHEDGRAALVGGETAATDPCCAGGPLLYIARVQNDPVLLSGAEKLLKWARQDAPRIPGGPVYHFLGSREIWADSVYMLPPFLAEAGYPGEAVTLMDAYFACLQDSSGLLRHRFDADRQIFLNPAHWGVGNGWALCALVRILPFLDSSPARARMLSRARALLDALLPFLRPDGLFHNVPDDPATFPEVNLSQMCASAIFTGFSEHWLPRESRYKAAARLMAGAALCAVGPDGVISPVCGAPRFDAPGSAPEGQAFFLIMKAALDRLPDFHL